jgi:hypothetical protein
VIEVNEIKPVEPSLTIVLRGSDIEAFKMIMEAEAYIYPLVAKIWEALS